MGVRGGNCSPSRESSVAVLAPAAVGTWDTSGRHLSSPIAAP